MFGFRQPSRTRSEDARALRPYYEYYVCRSSTNFEGHSKTCDSWGVRKETVELKVLDLLKSIAADPSRLDALAPPLETPDSLIEQEHDALLGEMSAYERRMRRWHEALEQAPDLQEMALTRLRELAEAQRQVSERLGRLEKTMKSIGLPVGRQAALAVLSSFAQSMQYMTPEQLRETVRVFVKRVTVNTLETKIRRNREKSVEVELYPL